MLQLARLWLRKNKVTLKVSIRDGVIRHCRSKFAIQQNLAYADIGVIVLVAINNRINVLGALMPKVNKAINSIVAGQVIEIKEDHPNDKS